jgi:Spy/CpxP family protein refolding chaperone
MIKKLPALCLAFGLSAAFSAPQGPPMDGNPPDPQAMINRRVDFLATMLNLTDTQKTKAIAIFTDAHTSSQSVRSNLRTNHDALADAVKKNDTAAIDTLALTAGTLVGQLTAIESKADAAFYAILTPDQQTKYDAMPHRGPGGPGGPGGPMGPGRFAPARNRNSQSQ